MGLSKNKSPKIQKRFQVFVEIQMPWMKQKCHNSLSTLKNSRKSKYFELALTFMAKVDEYKSYNNDPVF